MGATDGDDTPTPTARSIVDRLPSSLRQAWDRVDVRRWAVEPDVEIRLGIGPGTGDYSAHVVPWLDDVTTVVTLTAHGRWDLPGGRLDPAEGLAEAARRELLEEAGVEVVGTIEWFASVGVRRRPDGTDADAVPWRFVDVGWCDGRIVGPPTNPPGEVATVEVHCGPVDEAIERLHRSDRADLALCYETAAALRGHAGSA